jgi:hypothetical protein
MWLGSREQVLYVLDAWQEKRFFAAKFALGAVFEEGRNEYVSRAVQESHRIVLVDQILQLKNLFAELFQSFTMSLSGRPQKGLVLFAGARVRHGDHSPISGNRERATPKDFVWPSPYPLLVWSTSPCLLTHIPLDYHATSHGRKSRPSYRRRSVPTSALPHYCGNCARILPIDRPPKAHRLVPVCAKILPRGLAR